jgi:hypothetical protein
VRPESTREQPLFQLAPIAHSTIVASSPSTMARSSPPIRSSPSSATSAAPRTTRSTAVPVTGRDARRAFIQLQELDAARVSKRARHHDDPLPLSDGDEDSPHPLLDTFQASIGSEGVLKLCNFTLGEMSRLWSRVSSHMSTRWNVGRGNKCKHPPVDVLFMTLSVLKNCGRWDVLANTFHIKAPTFEKMTLRFLELLSPYLYKIYVANAEREWTMKKVVLAGHGFEHYPAARYAVDVTFQQANMPSGTQQERASYYSKKHKLHGFKTELSVNPTGQAVNCSLHYKGSVADITTFRKNSDFHVAATTKMTSEDAMHDEDPLRDEYPESWAILADKGYQGLASEMRVIYPVRRRPSTPLTLAEESLNHDISSDRVVVENYFGRLCTLWAVCADKYRWQEGSYEMFFRACVALTNLHARTHPLRAQDGVNYGDYLRRLYSIGAERRAHRLESACRARRRRELRLATAAAAVDNESDFSDNSTEY